MLEVHTSTGDERTINIMSAAVRVVGLWLIYIGSQLVILSLTIIAILGFTFAVSVSLPFFGQPANRIAVTKTLAVPAGPGREMEDNSARRWANLALEYGD